MAEPRQRNLRGDSKDSKPGSCPNNKVQALQEPHHKMGYFLTASMQKKFLLLTNQRPREDPHTYTASGLGINSIMMSNFSHAYVFRSFERKLCLTTWPTVKKTTGSNGSLSCP